MSWKRSCSCTPIVSTSARCTASPIRWRCSTVRPLMSETRTNGTARLPARERLQQAQELFPEGGGALAARSLLDLLQQLGAAQQGFVGEVFHDCPFRAVSSRTSGAMTRSYTAP